MRHERKQTGEAIKFLGKIDELIGQFYICVWYKDATRAKLSALKRNSI